MTRSFALLFAVTSLAIVCHAQQGKSHSGPSLNDTLEWMARTVNSATFNPRLGHGMWEYDALAYRTFSRTSIVFGPDAQHLGGRGCYAETVEINELRYSSPKDNARKKGYTTQTVLRFNLKDIDPGRVKAQPEDVVDKARGIDTSPVGGAIVEFYAADEKPAIRRQDATWNVDDYYHTSKENLVSCTGPDNECAEKEKTVEAGDLAVDSLEFAVRFAKAFRHAVELCGGKPSTF